VILDDHTPRRLRSGVEGETTLYYPASTYEPGSTEGFVRALIRSDNGAAHARLLEVTVTAEGDHARLSVRDDGVGGGFDRAADRRGLGQQLVRSLARQLGGEVRVETGAGTVVALEFPLRPPIERPPPGLLRGAKPPPVAAGAATPAAPPAAPSVGA
jgi:hypothetical protein